MARAQFVEILRLLATNQVEFIVVLPFLRATLDESERGS